MTLAWSVRQQTSLTFHVEANVASGGGTWMVALGPLFGLWRNNGGLGGGCVGQGSHADGFGRFGSGGLLLDRSARHIVFFLSNGGGGGKKFGKGEKNRGREIGREGNVLVGFLSCPRLDDKKKGFLFFVCTRKRKDEKKKKSWTRRKGEGVPPRPKIMQDWLSALERLLTGTPWQVTALDVRALRRLLRSVFPADPVLCALDIREEEESVTEGLQRSLVETVRQLSLNFERQNGRDERLLRRDLIRNLQSVAQHYRIYRRDVTVLMLELLNWRVSCLIAGIGAQTSVHRQWVIVPLLMRNAERSARQLHCAIETLGMPALLGDLTGQVDDRLYPLVELADKLPPLERMVPRLIDDDGEGGSRGGDFDGMKNLDLNDLLWRTCPEQATLLRVCRDPDAIERFLIADRMLQHSEIIIPPISVRNEKFHSLHRASKRPQLSCLPGYSEAILPMILRYEAKLTRDQQLRAPSAVQSGPMTVINPHLASSSTFSCGQSSSSSSSLPSSTKGSRRSPLLLSVPYLTSRKPLSYLNHQRPYVPVLIRGPIKEVVRTQRTNFTLGVIDSYFDHSPVSSSGSAPETEDHYGIWLGRDAVTQLDHYMVGNLLDDRWIAFTLDRRMMQRHAVTIRHLMPQLSEHMFRLSGQSSTSSSSSSSPCLTVRDYRTLYDRLPQHEEQYATLGWLRDLMYPERMRHYGVRPTPFEAYLLRPARHPKTVNLMSVSDTLRDPSDRHLPNGLERIFLIRKDTITWRHFPNPTLPAPASSGLSDYDELDDDDDDDDDGWPRIVIDDDDDDDEHEGDDDNNTKGPIDSSESSNTGPIDRAVNGLRRFLSVQSKCPPPPHPSAPVRPKRKRGEREMTMMMTAEELRAEEQRFLHGQILHPLHPTDPYKRRLREVESALASEWTTTSVEEDEPLHEQLERFLNSGSAPSASPPTLSPLAHCRWIEMRVALERAEELLHFLRRAGLDVFCRTMSMCPLDTIEQSDVREGPLIHFRVYDEMAYLVRKSLTERSLYVRDDLHRERALTIEHVRPETFRTWAGRLVDKWLRCDPDISDTRMMLSCLQPLRSYVIRELSERGQRGERPTIFTPQYLRTFANVLFDQGPVTLSMSQAAQLLDAYYWVHLAMHRPTDNDEVRCYRSVLDFYAQCGFEARLKKPHDRTGANRGKTTASGLPRIYGTPDARLGHNFLKSRHIIIGPNCQPVAFSSTPPRHNASKKPLVVHGPDGAFRSRNSASTSLIVPSTRKMTQSSSSPASPFTSTPGTPVFSPRPNTPAFSPPPLSPSSSSVSAVTPNGQKLITGFFLPVQHSYETPFEREPATSVSSSPPTALSPPQLHYDAVPYRFNLPPEETTTIQIHDDVKKMTDDDNADDDKNTDDDDNDNDMTKKRTARTLKYRNVLSCFRKLGCRVRGLMERETIDPPERKLPPNPYHRDEDDGRIELLKSEIKSENISGHDESDGDGEDDEDDDDDVDGDDATYEAEAELLMRSIEMNSRVIVGLDTQRPTNDTVLIPTPSSGRKDPVSRREGKNRRKRRATLSDCHTSPTLPSPRKKRRVSSAPSGLTKKKQNKRPTVRARPVLSGADLDIDGEDDVAEQVEVLASSSSSSLFSSSSSSSSALNPLSLLMRMDDAIGLCGLPEIKDE